MMPHQYLDMVFRARKELVEAHILFRARGCSTAHVQSGLADIAEGQVPEAAPDQPAATNFSHTRQEKYSHLFGPSKTQSQETAAIVHLYD